MMVVMVMTVAVLVLVMVIGLAACGNGGNTTPANNGNESKSEIAGTYKIKVWCPDAAVELTKKQIDDFNASNTMGIKFNYTVEPVSEPSRKPTGSWVMFLSYLCTR